MKRNSILLLFLLYTALPVAAQRTSVKTNLLYLATTTPNIGVEWKASHHTTVTLSCAYNPFRFKAYRDAEDNSIHPKLHHWMAAGEARYWLCEAFMGWNIGVNVFGGEYNIGGIRFIHSIKENRYDGWAAGAGFTAGYQFPLSERWSLDLSAGIGYVYARYNKYACYACGDKQGAYKRNYLGPTKAAVAIVYNLK